MLGKVINHSDEVKIVPKRMCLHRTTDITTNKLQFLRSFNWTIFWKGWTLHFAENTTVTYMLLRCLNLGKEDTISNFCRRSKLAETLFSVQWLLQQPVLPIFAKTFLFLLLFFSFTCEVLANLCFLADEFHLPFPFWLARKAWCATCIMELFCQDWSSCKKTKANSSNDMALGLPFITKCWESSSNVA